MIELVGGGVLSALGIFVILAQLDLLKVVGYHLWFDIGASCALILLFQGTFSGMIVGFTAGLTLTMMFRAVKLVCGHKRLHSDGWYYYPPEGTNI